MNYWLRLLVSSCFNQELSRSILFSDVCRSSGSFIIIRVRNCTWSWMNHKLEWDGGVERKREYYHITFSLKRLGILVLPGMSRRWWHLASRGKRSKERSTSTAFSSKSPRTCQQAAYLLFNKSINKITNSMAYETLNAQYNIVKWTDLLILILIPNHFFNALSNIVCIFMPWRF